MLLRCFQGTSRGTCGDGSVAFFVGGRPKSEKGGKGGRCLAAPATRPPRRPPMLAFSGTAPPEAGKGGKGGTGAASTGTPPAPPFTPSSVCGPQNCFRFWMLKQEFPQQVILVCADLCQSVISKAEVTERIQTGSDAKCIR
jgi:hypothetical protein